MGENDLFIPFKRNPIDLLGSFDDNSLTRWSISLSTSRFNYPLQDHFAIQYILYDKEFSRCSLTTLSSLCDYY